MVLTAKKQSALVNSWKSHIQFLKQFKGASVIKVLRYLQEASNDELYCLAQIISATAQGDIPIPKKFLDILQHGRKLYKTKKEFPKKLLYHNIPRKELIKKLWFIRKQLPQFSMLVFPKSDG